jgi:hypothetical protein
MEVFPMKRTIYGLLSLFAALILVRASSYGAVGRVIERTGDRLIGAAGVALLVVVLLAIAYHLLVPRAVRKWLMTFPELFHHAPVRVVQTPRRRRSAPRQQLVVVTGADLQGLGLQGLITAMNGGLEAPAAAPAPRQLTTRATQPIDVVAPEPELPYAERRRRTDVTGALKQLQYLKEEYEPLVAKMDFTRPAEELLREAIMALRRPDAARVVRVS